MTRRDRPDAHTQAYARPAQHHEPRQSRRAVSIWSKFGVTPVDVEKRADGSTVWRNRQALASYPVRVGEVIEAQVREIPDRVYIAQRQGSGWRRATYGEAGRAARAIAQALLDRKLGPERPVLIVAENGVDHAL
ncbi:MAG: AMP-binding protein, partial [Alphaproteobacteria bacterium]|nr:AMP-binding protein [Alphaproteobacteria bacterium]